MTATDTDVDRFRFRHLRRPDGLVHLTDGTNWTLCTKLAGKLVSDTHGRPCLACWAAIPETLDRRQP